MRRRTTAAVKTSFVVSARSTTGNLSHHFLNHVPIIQPDGLDDFTKTKIAQQQWLNTEQWDGYSDTYLARHMVYGSTVDAPTSQLTPKQPLLHPLLEKAFTLYGPLADILHDLQDDPLHPAFHTKINEVKSNVEKIAEELDRVYPALHPTVKTMYDAYLVRRYFHLRDWIKHVEKKREDILNRLSPDYIEEITKGRDVAQRHIDSLRRIAKIFCSAAGDADEGFLQLAPGSMFTLEEIQVVKQRARYARNMRRLGANWSFADQHTV
jgi:hypothetical protein